MEGSDSIDSTCNEYDAAMQAALVSLQTHRVHEAASQADDRKVSVTEAEARSLQRVSNHTAEAQMAQHAAQFLERNGTTANFEAWIALLHPENVQVDRRLLLPDSRHAAIWAEARRRAQCESAPDAPPTFAVTRLDDDACALWGAGPRPFGASSVEGEGLAHEAPLGEGETAETVTLWLDHPRQSMVGFGATMTESAAAVIMGSRWRDAILDDLFLPQAAGGAGLSCLRVPIGSCDFALAPPGAATHQDDEARPFDASRDDALLVPALRAARQRNPALKLIAAPWSAPRWMKSGGALVGGTLRPECVQAYCRYLLQWLLHFEARGLPIYALSVQNEPYHDAAKYPCMGLDVEQQVALVRCLVPLLRRNGIGTRVLAHDHNYAHAASAVRVLDGAAQLVDGSAWHAYDGDASALCHAQIQQAPIFVTEQTAHTHRPRDARWVGDAAWTYEQVLLRPVLHGACCGLQWNLALDDAFGPVLPGGPPCCRGVVEVPRGGGAHERSPEFYALAHLCHATQDPGCWHVTTCVERPHALAAAGFAHARQAHGSGDAGGDGGGGGGSGDGGSGDGGGGGEGGGWCGCVLHNKSDAPMRVTVRVATDAHASVLRVVALPPHAILSFAGAPVPPALGRPAACRAPRRAMAPARFDFPSSFYLRSCGHGTYLAAHGEHGGLVYASASEPPGTWERWTAVEASPRQFWLRSDHGTLVGANERGELTQLTHVNTLAALPLTVFVFGDGSISLMADRGVVHLPGRTLNGIGDWGLPRLKRTHIGAWEAFDVVQVRA